MPKSVEELKSTKAQIERAVAEIKERSGLTVDLSQAFIAHLAASQSWEELRSKAQQAGLPLTFVEPIIEEVVETTEETYGPTGAEGEPIVGREDFTYDPRSGGITGRPLTLSEQAAVESGAVTPEEMIKSLQMELGLGDYGEEGGYVDQSEFLGLGGIDPVTHADRVGSPDFGYGFRRGDYGSGTPYLSQLPLYQSGQEVALWAAMSPQRQRYWQNEMERAGLLTGGERVVGGDPGEPPPGMTNPGEIAAWYAQQQNEYQTMTTYSSYESMQAYKEVLGVANYMGITPELAIRQVRNAFDNANRAARRSGGGGGYSKPPFSIPAALRTVPDYDTLKQNVTNMMRQTMGRDPEDWEVVILADDLKSEHEKYNEQMIKAARAAYDNNRALTGIEVPDPTTKTQAYLEERYAPEIGRLEDIEEASASNQLMINAITKGANMIGGR